MQSPDIEWPSCCKWKLKTLTTQYIYCIGDFIRDSVKKISTLFMAKKLSWALYEQAKSVSRKFLIKRKYLRKIWVLFFYIDVASM